MKEERRIKLEKFKQKPKKEQAKFIICILITILWLCLFGMNLVRHYRRAQQEQNIARIEREYAITPSAKNIVGVWALLAECNSRDIYHYLDDAFSADNAEIEKYLSDIIWNDEKDVRGWSFKASFLSTVFARCSTDNDFIRFQMIFLEYIPKLPGFYKMVGIASQPEFFNKDFVYENAESILALLEELAETEENASEQVIYYQMIAAFYRTERGDNTKKYQEMSQKAQKIYEEMEEVPESMPDFENLEQGFVEYWEDIL